MTGSEGLKIGGVLVDAEEVVVELVDLAGDTGVPAMGALDLLAESYTDVEVITVPIGDTSAGNMLGGSTIIGNISQSDRMINDILFVVYTERERVEANGSVTEVTRLISARMATSFERGLYYGKYS